MGSCCSHLGATQDTHVLYHSSGVESQTVHVHNLGSTKRLLRYLDPCHLCGMPGLISRLLKLAQVNPYCCVHFGSEKAELEDLYISLPFKKNKVYETAFPVHNQGAAWTTTGFHKESNTWKGRISPLNHCARP